MPDRGVGNEAQTRVIAEQLFEVWKSQQSDMGQKQRASRPAWLGVGLAIVGIVFSAGSLRSEVAANTIRVEKVENRLDAQDEAVAKITDRLARIETKLDLVLEHRKGGQ